MSEWFKSITSEMKQFIAEQKVFFVATAPCEGRINLSPKGMDSFRVLDDNRVLYLDLTGSGNETAAHLFENGRITIMFCSFDKAARIIRLYGRGRAIHPRDAEWNEYHAMFPAEPGVRQIMAIDVETAMTSCGYGVPRLEGLEERDTLRKYWDSRGGDAAVKYQQKHNLESIDGLPTGIFADAAASSRK
jgi:pyridoxamine 5'-phosphate oxidase-like protein